MRVFQFLICSVLTFGLSACTNYMQTTSRGLQQLEGSNLDRAIQYLGYPDDEKEIAGKTVYIWDRRDVETYPVSTGVGFGTYGSGVSLGVGYPITRANVYGCRIRLFTEAKKIVNYELTGDGSGCAPYAKRLQPLLPAQNAK